MSGKLDTLREEHASLIKLEEDGRVAIQDITNRIQTKTAERYATAISTTRRSLHVLGLFVSYIQICDAKLQELPEEDLAAASNLGYEHVVYQESLQTNIQALRTSFEDALEALDKAQHDIHESQELLADFQYATAKPLKARIMGFSDKINSAQKDIVRELKSSEMQLNEVRRELSGANSEKVLADEKIDKREKVRGKFTKAARVSLKMTLLLGPAGALVGAGIAGTAALVTDMSVRRKSKEKRGIESRIELLESKISNLNAKATEIRELRQESDQLSKSGLLLGHKAEEIFQDSKLLSTGIESVKPHVREITQGLTKFLGRQADPLIYCSTRQEVLQVLEDAFSDPGDLEFCLELRDAVWHIRKQVSTLLGKGAKERT